jgi:hypothetical protein
MKPTPREFAATQNPQQGPLSERNKGRERRRGNVT